MLVTYSSYVPTKFSLLLLSVYQPHCNKKEEKEMSMEKHKCKLCSKKFSNGRALGGHMRAHLAMLPVPPKTTTTPLKRQLSERTDSGSSSLALFSGKEEEEEDEDEEEKESGEKILGYGLRENPKKSFWVADPKFLDVGSMVVQDGESETESTRNPTRKRSKPNWKPSSTESNTELEPMSSVSDTSPDEDVAICLMMLSRDAWSSDDSDNQSNRNQTRSKYQCETCRKVFRSFQALGGHRTSHKKAKNYSLQNPETKSEQTRSPAHLCPFCGKVFRSGQALGGHKRSHYLAAAAASTASSSANKIGENQVAEHFQSSNSRSGLLIDLNLPATMEEQEEEVEDFSQLEVSAICDQA